MSQQVIDGILYSPVLAHALRRGDLISTHWADMPTARLLSNAIHENDVWGPVCRFDTADGSLTFSVNAPVLRAVGAGVGGLI
jgi:hypothetical protein